MCAFILLAIFIGCSVSTNELQKITTETKKEAQPPAANAWALTRSEPLLLMKTEPGSARQEVAWGERTNGTGR